MHSERGLSISAHQDGPIPLAVELTCAPGEMVALVGPSGSGKTTILKTIAGLYRPKAALVRCGGIDWLDTAARLDIPPHRRQVGMMFQSYALFPHMTALRNVEAALGHVPGAERASRARALLRLVHLEGYEERKPASLSGGQQQRVAMARALARDPDVLLLDEPFSAVDRPTRRAFQRELIELRRKVGMPIVLVTHDLDEAALADRLYVLDRGAILQSGISSDVLASPCSSRVREVLDLPETASP